MRPAIITGHAVTRARERCPYLAVRPRAEIVAALTLILETGTPIPSCMCGHVLREGRLPGGQLIVVHVKPDDDDQTTPVVTTLFTEDMDIPAAEVGHPRKYGKAPT